MVNFIQDRIYDFVMDNVSGDNRKQATQILNTALDKFEDGELSLDELWRDIDKLLDLADPEKRPQLEQQLTQNRGIIERYFKQMSK
ncbi:MAG: hypothetical protein FWC81_01730 [Coriobacteriia bacterium]|nr:hypothetical protein [Coriobacteriia bacterium]